jgi:pimeloyl-ACP methyl ester carboxylesterase
MTTRRADGFLHQRLDVGAVHLHVAEARPRSRDGALADGSEEVPADVPLVVFLHGFPEHWWSWRHQLRAFADAGFWAVAPDLRGFNESDKPQGVESYDARLVADDIAGLIRALGRATAIVVGHDWGGIVAWLFAQRHRAMLSRLAVLNMPHPSLMMRGFLRLTQLRKSWYVLFFQLPAGIPERAIAKDNWARLRETFATDGLAKEDIEAHVNAMRRPGAVTAGMSYYRSGVRSMLTGRTPEPERIECPVLVIWGDGDRHLGKEMAAPPARFVPNARVEHIPEASHWVQNAAPERVNALLLAFARAGGGGLE